MLEPIPANVGGRYGTRWMARQFSVVPHSDSRTRRQLPPQCQPLSVYAGTVWKCIMEPATRRGPPSLRHNTSTSTLAFDQHFTSTAKGILLLSEIVCGMLVWILVGGTDHFHRPAFSQVMFVSIVFWILTVCLFIIYLTRAHDRFPQIPWTMLSICFNCSATALYLLTAVVDAFSVSQAIRGRHNYNCWAASAFFAFLTTLCYAGSSCLSLHAWKSSEEEH